MNRYNCRNETYFIRHSYACRAGVSPALLIYWDHSTFTTRTRLPNLILARAGLAPARQTTRFSYLDDNKAFSACPQILSLKER
jgi:hypothetical protein